MSGLNLMSNLNNLLKDKGMRLFNLYQVVDNIVTRELPRTNSVIIIISIIISKDACCTNKR